MKDNTMNRLKRKLIKEYIDNAGCIDSEVLLEDIKTSDEKIKERYGLMNDRDILLALRTYILEKDLTYAGKYGFEEILKWEHLKL